MFILVAGVRIIVTCDLCRWYKESFNQTLCWSIKLFFSQNRLLLQILLLMETFINISLPCQIE